jgi:hypothetical protein
MGFFDWLEPKPKRRARKPQRYTVTRIRLNRGGYDRNGRYWGVGDRLYRIDDEETGKHIHVRADSAKSARAIALRSNRYDWRRPGGGF